MGEVKVRQAGGRERGRRGERMGKGCERGKIEAVPGNNVQVFTLQGRKKKVIHALYE